MKICLYERDFQRFKGRRRPGASKMNFLLHLEDCRLESRIGLQDASDLLKQIPVHLAKVVDPTLQNWDAELHQDLERLLRDLDEVGRTLAELRTMVCYLQPHTRQNFVQIQSTLTGYFRSRNRSISDKPALPWLLPLLPLSTCLSRSFRLAILKIHSES